MFTCSHQRTVLGKEKGSCFTSKNRSGLKQILLENVITVFKLYKISIRQMKVLAEILLTHRSFHVLQVILVKVGRCKLLAWQCIPIL